MKVLVMGATGGTGRATTAELLRRGHTVTAFARSAGKLRHRADLPVHLTDGPVDGEAFSSTTGEIAHNKVARTSVARVIADTVGQSDSVGASIAVSGAAVVRAAVSPAKGVS